MMLARSSGMASLGTPSCILAHTRISPAAWRSRTRYLVDHERRITSRVDADPEIPLPQRFSRIAMACLRPLPAQLPVRCARSGYERVLRRLSTCSFSFRVAGHSDAMLDQFPGSIPMRSLTERDAWLAAEITFGCLDGDAREGTESARVRHRENGRAGHTSGEDVGHKRFTAESRRQRTGRHRIVRIMRALCTHWIRAGRTRICEKGLHENRTRTSPRRR
jgi:hypothetical protein